MTDNFRIKYKTTLLGLFGGLAFVFLCVLLYIIDKGQLILPLLYIPGAIFGIVMTFAFKEQSRNSGLLFIFSTFIYLIVIFFCSKDFEYLIARRVLMGGIGAILFLATLRFITTIKLGLNDYFFGFVIGTATTIFMWTDNFENFNIRLTILSIVLWQTLIAAIINRRQLTMTKNE